MDSPQLLITKRVMVVIIVSVRVGGNGEKRNEYSEKSKQSSTLKRQSTGRSNARQFDQSPTETRIVVAVVKSLYRSKWAEKANGRRKLMRTPGFNSYFSGLAPFCYDGRQRRGRTRSAERVEAHLQLTSFANLLSARIVGQRALALKGGRHADQFSRSAPPASRTP